MRAAHAIPVRPQAAIRAALVVRVARVTPVPLVGVIHVILAQLVDAIPVTLAQPVDVTRVTPVQLALATRAILAPRLPDQCPANALCRAWADVIRAIHVRRQVATRVIPVQQPVAHVTPVTPVVPVAMLLN